MKLSLRLLVVTTLTVLLIQCHSAYKFESDHQKSTPTPWSNLNFKDQKENFNFAIVSDRSSSHRPGVFEDAILKLNRMNPAFVVSIGDLIDTKGFHQDSTLYDDEIIRESWAELNTIVNQLEVPFFYTIGNNDIRNNRLEKNWVRQFGKTYYYFKYNNALFIVLNTENPPGKSEGGISSEQLNWLRATLQKNGSVKWTFLFLHRPLWLSDQHEDWQKIEEIIKDRPLTAFAGHKHKYSKTIANNQIYYALATTGGGSNLSGIEEGEFDHIVWVSISEKIPTISNIMLNGIWGDNPPEEIKLK